MAFESQYLFQYYNIYIERTKRIMPFVAECRQSVDNDVANNTSQAALPYLHLEIAMKQKPVNGNFHFVEFKMAYLWRLQSFSRRH